MGRARGKAGGESRPPQPRRACQRRKRIWGSGRAGRGHGEFFGLSIAECYVKPTTHAATEERLVSAVESIRGDFRELGRRLDRYFGRLHDKPNDRPIERKAVP